MVAVEIYLILDHPRSSGLIEVYYTDIGLEAAIADAKALTENQCPTTVKTTNSLTVFVDGEEVE